MRIKQDWIPLTFTAWTKNTFLQNISMFGTASLSLGELSQ